MSDAVPPLENRVPGTLYVLHDPAASGLPLDLRSIAGFRTEMDAFNDPEDEEGRIRPEELPKMLEELRGEMLEAAKALDFERAAEVRARIRALEAGHLGMKTGKAPS